MATLGDKKQEAKLNELATIAKQLYPNINELAVKGAFRQSAKETVAKSRFSNWSEVAEQPPPVRKQFFEALLTGLRPHIEPVVGQERVEEFIQKMRRANDKYLRN